MTVAFDNAECQLMLTILSNKHRYASSTFMLAISIEPASSEEINLSDIIMLVIK